MAGPAVDTRPPRADEPASPTCAARVAEARFELDDLREAERLAPIALDADQAVLDLLEPLWEARSTERLRYLEGKRNRDRARLEVERAGVLAAMRELRSREFATEQSLIVAKYDVERANAELKARRLRVSACKKPETRAHREPELTEADPGAAR